MTEISAGINANYDPAKGEARQGITPGTPFGNLPDDWICPICKSPKDMW